MIGGQGIEFHQHHAHGRVGNNRNHVPCASRHAAQGFFNAGSHRGPLAQIIFHQVGNHAARREFARRSSLQAASVFGEAPRQHPVRRDFASQLRLRCI